MPVKKAAKKKSAKRKASAIKYSYNFGKKTDGNVKLRELLGGKGANLAEMAESAYQFLQVLQSPQKFALIFMITNKAIQKAWLKKFKIP